MAGLIKRLRGDRRGVSAVEFALLAPIMIAFYFGLCEFCQAFMAQQRMGHASATVADLVTQTQSVTQADIDDIFSVGDVIMSPFPADSLRQRVTSLTMDNRGRAKVDWSRGDGMSPRSPGATVTIPEGLIGEDESIVMTEIEYDFDSPVDFVLPTLTEFSNTYYLRPRRVDRITLD